MSRTLSVVGVAVVAGMLATPALAFDELMPGKLIIVKPSGKLVKVLAKAPNPPLFMLPGTGPDVAGATLRVFDTGGTGGDDTYNLPPGAQWKVLGTGFKYKGAGTAADPCKVVLIKTKLVKAVCKDFASGGGGITLTVPFSSSPAGAILTVGTDRYCASWGGTEIKNDVKLLKRKDATPPPGCPTLGPTATSTSTPPPATPTPTATNTPVATCPLAAGAYTLTQVSGGNLIVDGLPAFPFPAGGMIIQDVAAASAPACVHNTVVPFPGGFSAPPFCIPALGFTTRLDQTGCGIGRIDSNGGSDFTITEIGDTSAPNPPCNLPASCSNGANSNVRVDVTVGDSVADTCGSGTANATVSVPVFTTTWLTFSGCPDPDGMYNPGPDTLIVSFPQTLDFTTDSTSADWADSDPDGCCIAGAGPGSNTNPCNPGGPGGFSGSGTCINLAGINLAGVDTTTVAAGTIGSSGSPLFDLTFISTLPNEVTGPAAPLGAVCGSPPVVTYGGTAIRCIP